MPFERKEEFCVLKREMARELVRCDAGDDMRHAIQGERLPDDVRIGARRFCQNVCPRITTGSVVSFTNPGPRASATPIVLK